MTVANWSVTIGSTPTDQPGADGCADGAAGPGDVLTAVPCRRIGVGDVTTISVMDVACCACAVAIPTKLVIGTIAAPDSKSPRVYFNILSEPLPRPRARSGCDERSCYDCVWLMRRQPRVRMSAKSDSRRPAGTRLMG